MYSPNQIVDSLFDCFDQGAIFTFREYIKNNPQITKWMIASDYCLHDTTRPSDAFAFSLIPYNDSFPNIRDRIRSAIPFDIKKTKGVSDATVQYLRQEYLFHIGVVLEKERKIFTDGIGTTPLLIARDSLRLTREQTVEKERGKERIERIKKLEQESLSNNFNLQLLTDLVILSSVYTFICLLIARESKPEVIGWFSDRDNLTTWCEGVIFDFALEDTLGVGERLGIPIDSSKLIYSAPDPTSATESMWFDELVRVADYFAGTLAAWDIKSNLILKDKFRHILRDVISDAPNAVILRLVVNDGLQTSRLIASKPVQTPTLYIGRRMISVSKFHLSKVADRLFRQPSTLRKARVKRARECLFRMAEQPSGWQPLVYQKRLRSLAAILLSQGITRL